MAPPITAVQLLDILGKSTRQGNVDAPQSPQASVPMQIIGRGVQGDYYDDKEEEEEEDEQRNEPRVELGNILDNNDLDFTGNFYHASLVNQAPNPCIQVAGFGTIGLPLSERDAKSIIAWAMLVASTQTEGERTVVNKECGIWEIEIDRVSFNNSEWRSYVEGSLCQEVCKSLGVKLDQKTPRLESHKLLLYEQGSHILPHQDAQKTDDAFATVMIILPSAYTGGQLHVSHASTTKVIDFAAHSMLSSALLAWYTDVKHEIKPITSGYRLALSYRLIHAAPPGIPKPSPPEKDEIVAEIRRVLQKWLDGEFDEMPKLPLVAYILDHQYSPTDLHEGFKALKGADADKVSTLRDVADELGFMMGLATLEYLVSGPGDDAGYRYRSQKRRRWGRYRSYDYDDGEDDDEDYDMDSDGEVPDMLQVDETWTTISDLVDLEGNILLPADENIYLADENLVQDDPFEDRDPDSTDHERYPEHCVTSVTHLYQNTVLFVIRKDELDDVFFSAGGLAYAFQKLKNLGAGQPSMLPTTEMRHWIAKIMSQVVHLKTDQAMQLFDLSVQWKDKDMFHRIIKCPDCDACAIGDKRLLKAWRAFSFEIVRPTLETLLDRAITLAEKINLIFITVKPNALAEDKEEVLNWCSKQCTKVLSSFSTAQARDVSTVMNIIRRLGLGAVQELMLPNIMKQSETYSFLVVLIKALREQRQAILVNSISMSGFIAAPPSGDVVDGLIADCLSAASKQWSHVPPNYDYGYETNLIQTKLDRIIELLEQALISRDNELCKNIMDDVLSTIGTSAESFSQTYVPFIPRLKELLSSQNRDVSSVPFVGLFQTLIGSFLNKVLGAKGNLSTPRLRKIGCGCPDCGPLDKFVMNPLSSTGTFKLAQRYRTHLEAMLNTAKDLCTYTTVRSGIPHELKVTKLPEVVQASMWEYHQKQAVDLLAAVGSDEVIKQVMGARYPDVIAALNGSAQFGDIVAAGTNGSASEQPSGSPATATSQQIRRANHVAVAGQKRKEVP